MDNPKKLAMYGIQDPGQINVRENRRSHQNGQSRETSNIRYIRRRIKKQKHNTMCIGHFYKCYSSLGTL